MHKSLQISIGRGLRIQATKEALVEKVLEEYGQRFRTFFHSQLAPQDIRYFLFDSEEAHRNFTGSKTRDNAVYTNGKDLFLIDQNMLKTDTKDPIEAKAKYERVIVRNLVELYYMNKSKGCTTPEWLKFGLMFIAVHGRPPQDVNDFKYVLDWHTKEDRRRIEHVESDPIEGGIRARLFAEAKLATSILYEFGRTKLIEIVGEAHNHPTKREFLRYMSRKLGRKSQITHQLLTNTIGKSI